MIQAMQHAIYDGLFTWPSEEPQLLGSKCKSCGEVAFPAQNDCRKCGGRDTRIVEIGNVGTLWTWTIQSFMPKAPYNSDETLENFRPYGVGYIEMPGGVRVESRLHENHAVDLKIGMQMKLEIIPFRKEKDKELMTFQFRRAEEKL